MNLCNVWISQNMRVYFKHPFEGWLSVESTADTSRVNYVIIIQHSVLCHSHWYDRLLRINRSANEFPGAFCRSLLGQLSAFVEELSNKSRHGGDGRLLPTYDNSLTYSLIFRTWRAGSRLARPRSCIRHRCCRAILPLYRSVSNDYFFHDFLPRSPCLQPVAWFSFAERFKNWLKMFM